MNEARNTDQVTCDVVPIEAEEGEELMQRVHLDQQNREQQRVVTRHEIGSSHQRARDDVEVHAAQIRAQPARAPEAVAVRDVAVEDRPHQIDADADDAGPRASITACGRMPELMHCGGGEGETEDHQHERRLHEDVLRRLGHAMVEKEPVVEDADGRDHRQDDRGEEQWCRQPAGGAHESGGYDARSKT